MSKLLKMYCDLYGIGGMYGKKDISEATIKLSRPKETCITLIYMKATAEWEFGDCSFKHEADHIANFPPFRHFRRQCRRLRVERGRRDVCRHDPHRVVRPHGRVELDELR